MRLALVILAFIATPDRERVRVSTASDATSAPLVAACGPAARARSRCVLGLSPPDRQLPRPLDLRERERVVLALPRPADDVSVNVGTVGSDWASLQPLSSRPVGGDRRRWAITAPPRLARGTNRLLIASRSAARVDRTYWAAVR